MRRTALQRILGFLTREEVILSLVFLLAFTLRLLHILRLGHTPPFSDEAEYDAYGVNMLRGLGFGTPAARTYRGPVYGLFLSVVYFLYGHEYQIARAAQAIIDSISCVLIYLLAKRLFSKLTGYAAAVIASLFTLSIFYSGLLLTETVYGLLIIILILTVLKTLEDPCRRNLIATGALLGVTALTRAEILFTFAFMAPVFLVRQRRALFRAIGQLALIGAVSLAVILPWTARNYLVTQRFVFISSQGGENFWMGNNPKSDGMHMTIPAEVINSYVKREDLDKDFFRMGIDFIRNDPGRWFRLAAVKIRCYFGFWIDAGQWQFAERFGFINDAAPPLVTLSLLSVLAVAGMVLTLPYYRKLMLLYAILASNLCLQIVLYVEPRFRMQIAPVLIVFAASPVYVIERLSTYIRPRHGLGAREKGK